MLSSCKWQSNCFRNAFWYDGPILEKGLPKYDAYFEDLTLCREKVQNYFKLPKDIKFVVYAPTFRESRRTDMYKLDYEQLLVSLGKRFGGKWAVLVCLHPNIDRQNYPLNYTDRILNTSAYGNMQDLLAASDVIISDYSGCVTDFVMIERPGFLY